MLYNIYMLYMMDVTTYCGNHFVKYVNVESLRCTPETNTIIVCYVSTIIKNNLKNKVFLKKKRLQKLKINGKSFFY